jgi:hypothetical protein
MDSSALAGAEQARDEVLSRVLVDGSPLVIVDSPPGAGKTSLVEDVIAAATRGLQLSVLCVMPRVEQTYALCRRLWHHYPDVPIQLHQSSSRSAPDDLASNPRLIVVNRAADVRSRPGVTIAVAAKAQFSVEEWGDHFHDLLICDEAYQLPFMDFAPLFTVARQTLLVGDPGQLPPLVTADVAWYEGADVRVHWAVPKELARRYPNVPTVRLPATRRLPSDTTEVVQPALYPQLAFTSTSEQGDRWLSLRDTGAGDVIDTAVDLAQSGASIVGILLPPREAALSHEDNELSQLVAGLAARLLRRGATTSVSGQLSAADIGCVDSHVVSGAATRRFLLSEGLPVGDGGVMVDTPEIWQGLERPVMVVKHPLSGAAKFDAFGFEPGRFCVMLSRHQVACFVVSRDGIGERLDAHLHDCASRPLESENAEWTGWNAHRAVWGFLEGNGRLVRETSRP